MSRDDDLEWGSGRDVGLEDEGPWVETRCNLCQSWCHMETSWCQGCDSYICSRCDQNLHLPEVHNRWQHAEKGYPLCEACGEQEAMIDSEDRLCPDCAYLAEGLCPECGGSLEEENGFQRCPKFEPTEN